MKWTKKKSSNINNLDYKLTGRKSGIRAEVIYSEFSNDYHFVLHKGDYVYDSLWQRNAFKTEGRCKKACEVYIDRVSKEW